MSPHLRALAFELWDASRECSRGSKHHRVRITLSHLKPQYASQGNAHEAPCHCLHPLDSDSPALAWHTRHAQASISTRWSSSAAAAACMTMTGRQRRRHGRPEAAQQIYMVYNLDTMQSSTRIASAHGDSLVNVCIVGKKLFFLSTCFFD